jgi:hypothetical protein
MSEPKYYKLDDFVYYGDSLKTIQGFEWFNTFPFQSKKQCCYILRSPLPENNLRDILMDIFPKIFSSNVEILGVIDEHTKVYLITFTLHYNNFWDNVVDKLFLYSMAFLNTMDFHMISEQQPYFSNFADNLMISIEQGNFKVIPEKFFDDSMGRLLVSIQRSNKNDYIPMWGCMNTDIEAIKTILTSPRNLREVLLKIPRMNCTRISQEISDEYSMMRRTL